MRTLNLGILAHVDAGKTSLTERLLHDAGVVDELGSVDAGSTRTDTLALERQRGITIKSAVVSFVIDEVTVNLIDTPGHPDFIAEVERVLDVLDGAVLVVSAVEGVQAQTRILMRTLRRLGIPTLIFVNKIDRRGADCARTLRQIAEKLTPAVIAMGAAHGQGTRDAVFTAYGEEDPGFAARLVDLLSWNDDALLAAYVEGPAARDSPAVLREQLAVQTARNLVHPVFCGSAITGAGVAALTAALTRLLPAHRQDTQGAVSGTVFKVERGPAGEKIAYVRMFSGELHTRGRLRLERGADGAGSVESRVTAIDVFEQGAAVRRPRVGAGRIGKLRGLDDVRIGDVIGTRHEHRTSRGQFAPPTLETVVVPRHPADKGALHAALTLLAEQDPLIDLRLAGPDGTLSLSLYGEVQKEIIQTTLALDFGIDAAFRRTTTICVERVVGTGADVEIINTPSNPFRATVGLRVDAAPPGSGVRFRREVELGAMPQGYFNAVEETVTETLRQGLCGWQVTDGTVTLTHATHKPPPCTPGDFRHLTPLILMNALRQAGTQVCEPMHRLHLEVPADALPRILTLLGRLRATPHAVTPQGSSCLLEGTIPAAEVHTLQTRLPGLTHGEGVLETPFDGHRPVVGPAPARARTDGNPLNRKEYLRYVARRAGGDAGAS